ncbi:T-cell immunomodulatory protein-like [Haliotis rubra]|uniref:T-cell immunomodulatory protein-like n=1 Tax=Haliotis rubra TaxID=36100 RepID=UPI001EE57DC2|nr:T-cell immunomodulatory protein-like [Haliotis rubra]
MFLKLTLVLVILECLSLHSMASLSDVTSLVFGDSSNGIVAAFGDFDADKSTDIFVLSKDGKRLCLLLGHAEVTPTVTDIPFLNRTVLEASDIDPLTVTSVVPADFDGDSMMDVMLILQDTRQPTNSLSVRIYWGNGLNLDRKTYLNLNETLRDQPQVLDANGDMIPDLLAEFTNKSRAFWIFSKHRNYTVQYLHNGTSSELPELHVPQASGFLDINHDMTPDLIVMSLDSQMKKQFEIWNNTNGEFIWNQTIPIPDEAVEVGHPTFVDMNSDHRINIVLPACTDAACSSSMIFVWSQHKWHKMGVNFKESNGRTWNFVPMANQLPPVNIPPMLRAGDLNLNSYPDAVTVLSTNTKGNKTYGAFFLENVACSSACDGFSQTYSIAFHAPLQPLGPDMQQVSFFDLQDDGVLDILVNTISSKDAHITALRQTFSEDACFLKVLVVSGLCNENCPDGHKPYGVNQVGPVVRFTTTRADGDTQIGVASQLTQTAYFSLQLPFVHFGLGQMPNFVDKLEVGIQHPKDKPPRHKEWTQLIPNSQLVIIPYPLDDPSSWVNILFLTPSRLVLLTGAALLGTCGFIAGIVGILHWRERAEDKKEKLQEAHKFHFDAM